MSYSARINIALAALLCLGINISAFAAIKNLDTGETYRPSVDEQGNLEEAPEWLNQDLAHETQAPSLGSTLTTMTIHGRVFYNDRRQDGLFAARRTKTGAIGTRCNPSGQRDDGSACTTNWLGAQYMVVDVIERDEGFFAPTAWDCKNEDILASVAVSSDGSFSATIPVSDACDSDALSKTAIVLKVRMKYCGDWCFSVNIDNNTPYSLYYPGATPTAPLLVSGGQEIVLPDMNFNPGGTAAGTASDVTRAANYYASLVDTVLTVHRDNGIPFYKDAFGEIKYIYPSNDSSTATAKSATKVVISNFEGTGWINGDTPAHEYGHVMMLRAWDGDYGFDGVGISANDTTIAPSRQIAFKEAWAEFITHAVFTETDQCSRSGFDDNASKPLTGALGQGAQFRLNVTKALCDWYDTRDDNDLSLAGAGDHFAAADLYSVWYNLRQMYLKADDYGADYSGEGLWFCDYVQYYLDVRKSTAAVGISSHNDYVSKITDLIYNNNIGCFMPSP